MTKRMRTVLRVGFTLIELLLVIGIVAVLASIVIVAINPQRQLESAREGKRNAESVAIRNAINQFYLDHQRLPGDKTWESTEEDANDICAPGVTDASCINIEGDLVPTYMAAIPTDPSETNPLLSGYAGYQTTSGTAFLVAGVRIVIFSRHAADASSVSSGY